MTRVPRRRIEPLPPPSGSFGRMLERARARRRRQVILVATSVTALMLVASGAVALTTSLKLGVPATDEPADRATPTSRAALGISPTPSPGPHKHSQQAHAGAGIPGSSPVTYLRGRAVDSDHKGIAGLLVQPGAANMSSYSSDGYVAAVTDAGGYYTIRCPHAPVLLATWQIDHPVAGPTVGGQWGASFVAGSTDDPDVPRCGQHVHVTTLSAGATISGLVQMDGSCPPQELVGPNVLLYGDPSLKVRLSLLQVGDTFTFAGLPPGTHVLGAGGMRVSVGLAAGASAVQDAVFPCDPPPSPSPDPTSTVDEVPTPSSSP